MDVVSFGRFASIATTALAVIIEGNLGMARGRRWKVEPPYTLEQPRRRDFWKMAVKYFTEELCIQSSRVTRSTSDEFFDAAGPLAAPAASSLGEPVAIMLPLHQKSVSIAVLQIAQNTT